MKKTQQDYIRKQAKVKTEPAKPTMRKEEPAKAGNKDTKQTPAGQRGDSGNTGKPKE